MVNSTRAGGNSSSIQVMRSNPSILRSLGSQNRAIRSMMRFILFLVYKSIESSFRDWK